MEGEWMTLAEVQTELRKLPLTAIVAFAARCARRVQPIYWLPPGTPDRTMMTGAVDRAISLAEQFARERWASAADSAMPLAASAAASIAAHEADHHQAYPARGAACAAAQSASLAGGAARQAAKAIRDAPVASKFAKYSRPHAADNPVADSDFVVDSAADASAYADDAAAFVANAGEIASENASTDVDVAPTTHAAQHDRMRLLSLQLGAPLSLGDPIDAREAGPLGPLWPSGAPDWYVEALNR
jgi:hypothetical protein